MRWRWMVFAVAVVGVIGAGPAPTGTLRGVIVSGRKTVSYAQVMIHAVRMGTIADDTGAFVLKDVPAGIQHLSVRQAGFPKLDTTLTVVAGENPALRLVLVDPRDRIPCDSCFWVDPFQGSRADASGICLDYKGEDWRASTRTRAGALSLASDPNPCVLQIDLSPKHAAKRGTLVIVDAYGHDVHAFEFAGGGGIHTSWTGVGNDGRLLPIGSYLAVFRTARDTVALGFERVHRPPLR